MTWRNVRKQGWVFPLFSPDSDDQVGLGKYCLPKVSNGFKFIFCINIQDLLKPKPFSFVFSLDFASNFENQKRTENVHFHNFQQTVNRPNTRLWYSKTVTKNFWVTVFYMYILHSNLSLTNIGKRPCTNLMLWAPHCFLIDLKGLVHVVVQHKKKRAVALEKHGLPFFFIFSAWIWTL